MSQLAVFWLTLVKLGGPCQLPEIRDSDVLVWLLNTWAEQEAVSGGLVEQGFSMDYVWKRGSSNTVQFISGKDSIKEVQKLSLLTICPITESEY